MYLLFILLLLQYHAVATVGDACVVPGFITESWSHEYVIEPCLACMHDSQLFECCAWYLSTCGTSRLGLSSGYLGSYTVPDLQPVRPWAMLGLFTGSLWCCLLLPCDSIHWLIMTVHQLIVMLHTLSFYSLAHCDAAYPVILFTGSLQLFAGSLWCYIPCHSIHWLIVMLHTLSFYSLAHCDATYPVILFTISLWCHLLLPSLWCPFP